MIKNESHTKEWLDKTKWLLKGKDPILIKKVIKALTLLEQLTHPADLLEIWVQRTLKPAQVCRALKLAEVLAASLSESDSPEPIILLLSHPFFGAEDEVPKVKNLRGLFVQYPGETVTPVMSPVCEKWRSLETHQANDLPQILGALLA